MKYFLSLFLGVFVLQLSAQGLILKEPQFPEPEKNVLYFLQEDVSAYIQLQVLLNLL